jgi:hypothetical protein
LRGTKTNKEKFIEGIPGKKEEKNKRRGKIAKK